MRDHEDESVVPHRLVSGRRLLTVGIAGALIVGTTAVAKADPRHWYTQSNQTRSSAGSRQATRVTTPLDPTARKATSAVVGSLHGKRIVLPASVAPPAGTRALGVFRGTGVLVYTCTAGSFTLTRPQLHLFTLTGQPVGLHTRPLTWQSAHDGSRVDAVVARQVRTRSAIGPALLKAVNVYGGRGLFGQTAFIAALPLTGGVPPTACAVPGRQLNVPFQTLYVFFRSVTNTVRPTPTTPPTTTPTATPTTAPTPSTGTVPPTSTGTPTTAPITPPATSVTTVYGPHW